MRQRKLFTISVVMLLITGMMVFAGGSLGKAKQQCQVALNRLLFQLFRRPDSFPGAGYLDKNTVAGNTPFLIKPDESLCPLDRWLRVKGEARVNFR